MQHTSRIARFRPLVLLGGLDLHAVICSPAMQTSPLLLTALATLATLPVLASGALASPLSPAWRLPRSRRGGALGAGLTSSALGRMSTHHRAGGGDLQSGGADLLARLPATHLALDLRLARLRRSKTLLPHLAGLDGLLTKTLDGAGSGLARCAPRLYGRLDRLVISAPLPGALGARAPRPLGPATPALAPIPGLVVRADAPASGPAVRADAPILGLAGRFDAPALARCLAKQRGAARLPSTVIATALDGSTLLLAVASPSLGKPIGSGTGPVRGTTLPVGRMTPPPADADTVLWLDAPGLNLTSLRVPALEELERVRAAELLVGLPSDHLLVRLTLRVGDRATASALALKLTQAITLASFAMPTTLGLTQALQSAKIHALGSAIHLELRAPPGDLQKLLAQLTQRMGSGPRGARGPLSNH